MDRITSSFVVPRLAACICVLIGLANAIGWGFEVPLLVSILPGLPKMVPASTLLVLLCAASLACQARARPLRGPALACGALAALLGLAMALGHLFKLPIGPFIAAVVGVQTAVSLSSVFTSAMFLGLGSGLALFALRRSPVLAQAAAIAVFLVSLLNAGGYFFRDTFLYDVLPGQGVAIPTTFSSMLLAVGVLFLRPGLGIMAAVTSNLPAIRIARRLLLSAVMVPLALGVGVTLALQAGLYDAVSALPLLVWGTIVVFTVIIWRLCLQLHEVELARQQAGAELRRTLHELHEADQRKDVFLATLAHELRNPLGPIRTALALLCKLDPVVPAMQDNARRTIGRHTSHLVRLVDDLLDVSRISQGKISLQWERVSMASVIRSALETSSHSVEARGHALDVSLPREELWVCGDAVRLSQIVANLLLNAAKFTAPGGRITISAAREDDKVRIRLSDNGIGIAAASIDSIFDLFEQSGHAPDRVQDGLGIGLSLVRKLVTLHGGQVSVHSPGVGLGSTFEVVLPLDAQVPPPAIAPVPETASGGSQRILVVDDNCDAADTLAELLEMYGHTVRTAYTGAQAIERTLAFTPDIVFLDIGLPDMSGYEVAGKLRQLPIPQQFLLVALTGYGQEHDRQTALQAGFNEHFAKPVDFGKLAMLGLHIGP